MDFRLLGPLEVATDDRTIPIGSGRLKCLLAVLVVNANTFVGFDELVEAIWGTTVPVNPRPAVHTCVARLRSALAGEVRIEAGSGGYRIVVGESRVDVKRFEALILRARTAGWREAEMLTEALGLWRGEALADVPSDYLRQLADLWWDRRLQVLERKLELDLRAGLHDSALPDLQKLAVQYPLRERFWALLITALSRCGRQADALHAYSTVRQRLVDELGVDPGPGLRQAHQAVLTGQANRLVSGYAGSNPYNHSRGLISVGFATPEAFAGSSPGPQCLSS
ncbi:AfsR/SARP family transcriptional regulator [Kibdelosporangium philippinense]|uniref:AfsR/SARP family transcriptional regulator n=1 Tax=Kibdelosporangium philippinense TaxID=211113 RepID=A0ABS8ZQ62_9PSEU|nr:AfsR/SARP family transcriptional regulator [Kibdelosporangium philippinense]MCE7009876.1 AfsR/SARP family transcriptional regulator [Kibdelosporangium philippinense]